MKTTVSGGFITVECGVCRNSWFRGRASLSPKRAGKEFAKQGWQVAVSPDGKRTDAVCPLCVEEINQAPVAAAR